MCSPLFKKWAPIIKTHATKPNTEIEFRFGRPSGKGFDTNVGREAFENARRALEKFPEWDSTKHSKASVYYFEGSKRLVVDDETDEQVGQIKKKVSTDDFAIDDAPFNVRLGISTEEPFEYNGEIASEEKTRERWSFVRKNLSIDLSVVTGTPDDKDMDDDTVYQIEMEIVDTSKIESDVVLFNLIHKIFDVLKCV